MDRLLSRRLLVAVCALGALVTLPWVVRAQAPSWDASLDVRFVDSDASRSYLNGGLGALRYGSDQSALEMARLRFALSQPLGQLAELHLDASSWGDHDKAPAGLTEAYIELRPYPTAGLRTRIDAGAFYAPISLENRAAGWESPYTLSYSALDSWIAEELRTIGVQAQLEWLGSRLGHDIDLSVTGAVFGWNESAGVSIAAHGFAIDDRQTTLFGRVGKPGSEPVSGFEEFRQFDSHAGDYAAVEVRYLDRITASAMHYDNHANPSAHDATLQNYAWNTHFNAAGIRAESAIDFTAIAQWMQGETYVAPEGYGEAGWQFTTRYVLLSQSHGHQRLSARYDDFSVSPEDPMTGGAQRGHGVTVAYGWVADAHWRCMLEWVRVRSSQSNRFIVYGQSPYATDSLVQLSVRYGLSSDD